MHDLKPFLMFCGDQFGKAEEAIDFYCTTFEDSRVVSIDRYGADAGEQAGTVRVATFELGRKPVMAIDSNGAHAFTFTPAISLWIDCSSEEEIERVSAALSEGGHFLMPLDNYGFSPQFCWVADRYGVTWQLNRAE